MSKRAAKEPGRGIDLPDPAVAFLSLDLVSTRQRLKHSASVVCLLLAHHKGIAQSLGEAFGQCTLRALTDGWVLSSYGVWAAADRGGPFAVGKRGHGAGRQRRQGTSRTQMPQM